MHIQCHNYALSACWEGVLLEYGEDSDETISLPTGSFRTYCYM